MIVQLIVTGEMEKAALAEVLGACFPELTFRPGPLSLADPHHPKNYLRLLAPSFTETGNETGGAAALRALDCARLQERSGLRFLRSLLFDLAWAAGVNNPLGEPTHPLTWPERTTDPRRRVLRNG